VPSLTLALRAMWFRRGVSLAILLVATVTTAAAAAGPLYLRAGGESVLRDALTSPDPDVVGLDVTNRGVAGPDTLGFLNDQVMAAKPPFAFLPPVHLVQSSIDIPGRANYQQTHSRLMWREGQCEHLRLVAGRCPTGPADALVSVRSRLSAGLGVGAHIDACPGNLTDQKACLTTADQVHYLVTGVYALPDNDPYWFNQPYFNAHPSLLDEPDTLDTTFLSQRAVNVIPPISHVNAEQQLLLDPSRVRLADQARLRAELASFSKRLAKADATIRIDTLLTPTLDRADRDRHDLRTAVLVVTLQLVLLAFVVLRLVVADASEARAGEIALAKLRGYGAIQTLALGLVEPLLLALAAVPLGLLVAGGAVRLLSHAVLVAGTPVEVHLPSIAAAAGAFAGGVVAAAVASRRVLTRPVLDQWRRTGDVGPARATVLGEFVVGVLAAVALVVVIAQGALHEGSKGPLPLVVPLLLVVVVALLGVGLLPISARGLLGRTRGSSNLGVFLAVRALARRPAGLRLAALLTVAVGLATFAVDGTLVSSGNQAARAATDIGAPTVLTVRTSGADDLATKVRAVDPDGRWAMAAEVWLPFGGLRGSLLAVDSQAFAHVTHWQEDFAPQSLMQVAAAIDAPAPAAVALTGTDLGIDLRVVTAPTQTRNLQARVLGVNGPSVVDLGPVRPGNGRYTGRLPQCPCTLRALVANRSDVTTGDELAGELELTGIAHRTGAAWTKVPVDLGVSGGWHQQLLSGQSSSTVTAAGTGVDWAFAVSGGDSAVLLRSTLPWPLPIAQGRNVFGDPASPSVADYDGLANPVSQVGPVDVVPQLGRDASIADLDYARRALPNFEQFVTKQVWIGPDAPKDAVRRVRAGGLQVLQTRTTAGRRDLLARTAPALGLKLFAFAAAAAAILAAGATAVALYLSGRRRSFELAAMLAVGAQRRSLLAAAIGEQLLVLGTAVVLGVLSGLGAALLALPAVAELPDPGPPPLRYAPHLVGLAVFLAALVTVVLTTALGAATGLLRAARPGLLREAAP
jgi:putative ABC transport system permease protein